MSSKTERGRGDGLFPQGLGIDLFEGEGGVPDHRVRIRYQALYGGAGAVHRAVVSTGGTR